ncbi:MAG: hypothetical protein J6V04_03005 [Bacteroidales bacterium]|nr:hypothetical protein [Bacteroidales bacterium]
MPNNLLILTGKICPYCGKDSELIDSSEIYGTSYGPMYICRDCDAYVGCYTGKNFASFLRMLYKCYTFVI